MAGVENVASGIEAMSEMVDQLGKSLGEMESHRETLPNSKSLLDDVEQRVHGFLQSLKQKFDEIAAKERALEEKRSERRRLLSERGAALAAKEQVLWDRLQVQKDAAVSAITEARKKHREASPMPEKVSSLAISEAVTGKVDPLPQLKQLCEQMEFERLVKFIAENRRILPTIREKLPHALKCAHEPGHLVLNSLKGFYSESNHLQAVRRTCLLLMECAASLPGMDEQGSEIKQRAEVIAGEWKPKLAELDLDASNGCSLEAQAFLQLLVAFGVSSGLDEDELCRLVVAVSRRRRQASELCRALGLAHRVPDIVGVLVSKGKRIDAAQFSHDFQLTEMFPLVPLLKQYLERDATGQELGALKTVMKCIEEYELEAEFPPDALRQRIAEIEKDRANKKRRADSTKASGKKPWPGGGHAPRAPVAAVAAHGTRARHYVDGYRYRYAAARPYPAYGASGHGQYAHQGSGPRPYRYPEGRVAHPYGGSSGYVGYANPMVSPGNYESYVGSGMQPSSSSYTNYASGEQSYQPYL